ncbi:MAG: RagB/SusD family nutrient uptake outer membrane protein [Mangrovibacterium sp.]
MAITGYLSIELLPAPVFWLAEVCLNYAEARAELNAITQSDPDLSINKLRTRVGIASLQYISNEMSVLEE